MVENYSWGGKRTNSGRKKSSSRGQNLWIPADCLQAVQSILNSRIDAKKTSITTDTDVKPPLSSESIPFGTKVTSLKQLERLPKSVQRALIKDYGSLFNAFQKGVWIDKKKAYVLPK